MLASVVLGFGKFIGKKGFGCILIGKKCFDAVGAGFDAAAILVFSKPSLSNPDRRQIVVTYSLTAFDSIVNLINPLSLYKDIRYDESIGYTDELPDIFIISCFTIDVTLFVSLFKVD